MATGELIVGEIADEMGADPHSESPAGLIRLAITKDLDIEKLERLIQLQRQRDEDLARQEFCDALSRFQGDVPPIGREDRVDAGRAGRRKYASLGTIFQAIREPMRRHGLSFRFRQHQNGDQITVDCIVSHAMGHSEETSLSAAPDASGGKNPIQSMGSTVTYLQRYTLVAALGLTTVDDDTDGEDASAVAAEKERAAKAAAVKDALFNGGGAAGQAAAQATAGTSVNTVTTVEVTPTATTVKTEPAKPAETVQTSTDEAGTITAEQRKRIEELYDQLGVSVESRAKALASRKANSLRNLSKEQAGDILAKLESAHRQRQIEADKAKLSPQPEQFSQAVEGPATAEQITEAKRLLGELEQTAPGTTAKFATAMKAAGRKFADLTFEQCRSLIESLKLKTIEKWIEQGLKVGKN